MKTYFADTNIYLRYLLGDNKLFYKKAESWFKEAKEGKIRIIFIPQVIIEIDYVLDKVYSVNIGERVDYLLALIKTPYLKVDRRKVWFEALEIYKHEKIDLVDIFLFFLAKSREGLVLSFDKDIERLNERYFEKKKI